MGLKTSVNYYDNNQPDASKTHTIYKTFSFRARHTMMFIAHCSLFFATLQFVALTSYYTATKKKQQRTLNTSQLRFLG